MSPGYEFSDPEAYENKDFPASLGRMREVRTQLQVKLCFRVPFTLPCRKCCGTFVSLKIQMSAHLLTKLVLQLSERMKSASHEVLQGFAKGTIT